MIFNHELVLQTIIVAIVVEMTVVLFLQQIKELPFIKQSYVMVITSFIFNMLIGFAFALTFTDANIILGLWIGFFSFIGADLLYKALESKGLLKQLKDTIQDEDYKGE